MGAAASVDEDDDGFPRPFGQYLLLDNFARGGMGEVYLAKYGDVVEKYCVLKKLRSELTRDREYVTRFIDEARVVVTLNHANICHVFDVGRVVDEYYLAMEYVSGRDVRTIMDRAHKKEKPLPAVCALQLTCETLEALDYAHRRVHPMTQEALNLVHRDVSPQNVLVSYEGEVKLIDFGLAASKLKVERTQPNVVMGKMAYMAPEQARGDPIDARADLFACGVLCYELLAGERFYEGMTANDIWNVAGKGGFIPRKWKDIDPDIAKILAQALHPDVKKRFTSCGEFREALASHLHWRFPGSGVKSLRDVMADLFAAEIAAERDLLQRFGKVTVQSFRQEMESTQSHSITLVQSGGDNKAAGAALVRNEQSQSTGAVMPPPARDVHHEPTRMMPSPEEAAAAGDTAATKKSRSTDEASVASAAAARAPTAEMTARIVRSSSTAHHEPTALVRDRKSTTETGRTREMAVFELDAAERTALGDRRKPILLVGGALAALFAGVLAFTVASSGDGGPDSAPDERAATLAAVPPSPPVDARPPVPAPVPPDPPVPTAVLTVPPDPPVAAPADPPVAAPADPPVAAAPDAAAELSEKRAEDRAARKRERVEQERLAREKADKERADRERERRAREAAAAAAAAAAPSAEPKKPFNRNTVVKTLTKNQKACPCAVVIGKNFTTIDQNDPKVMADFDRKAQRCMETCKLD